MSALSVVERLAPGETARHYQQDLAWGMHVSLRFVIPLSILLAAGCATAAGTPSQQGQTSSRRDPNVIAAEELDTAPETDLYAAIQHLRPMFFETRGRTSPGIGTAPEMIQVYVDGSRANGVDALRQLRPLDVREVRHLSATEATQRYGTGHTMGAIVVTRK
jgi:hypothetical protein